MHDLAGFSNLDGIGASLISHNCGGHLKHQVKRLSSLSVLNHSFGIWDKLA